MKVFPHPPRRSPFTRPPLRSPGQSVQREMDRLLVRGVEFTSHPVRQVQALARWLSDQLLESTGRRSPIRPVVLVPGWFVEVVTKHPPEVWVLNPKQLSARIEREPMALKREDVALVASRLISDMQKP